MQLKKIITSYSFIYSFLALGIILNLFIADTSFEKANIRAMAELNDSVIDFKRKVNIELISAVEVGYSLANLVVSFDNLTYSQFQNFSNNLNRRKKSILLAEWQPKVLESEREEFKKRAISLGIKDFKLLEPDENGVLIKAKKRKVHYPVLFATSIYQNVTSIGLDLSWSEERMKSKLIARDSGVPRASNTFKVFFTGGITSNPNGFAITIPVYTNNVIPDGITKKRENLKGFLAIIYSVELLFEDHIQDLKNNNLNIQIVDSISAKEILHVVSGEVTSKIKSLSMDVFGQEWEINIIGTSKFINKYVNWKIWVLPSVFFILAVGLFILMLINRENTFELTITKINLENALQEAKASANSKTIFLANMSHEIRTPMSTILGFANLLKHEDDKNKRQEYVNLMNNSGKYLIKILDDVLDVSKLEESKIKIVPSPFYLSSFLEDLNKNVKMQFSNSSNRFILEEATNLPEQIVADKFRISQILNNLINNAFKFTSDGEIKLKCVGKELEDNKVELTFILSDTGKGISKSFQAKIFDPFTQEDSFFKRKHTGAGLGLSIVSRLCSIMNGSIGIQSELYQGTTFTVKLPVEVFSPHDNYFSSNFEPIHLKEVCKDIQILIAEDDKDARTLMDIYFQNEKTQFDMVNNGKELIEQFEKNDYKIILTDIQMPVMDGLEATRILREKGVRIPIIAISAHTLQDEKDKILQSGVTQIISKPFTKDYLIKTINSLIDE